MTCIVGLIEDGRIWMGADSCMANDMTRTTAESKVFRSGPYLIGCAGDSRESQLLKHQAKLPKPTGHLDGFMVAKLADAIRKCFKEAVTIHKENDRETHHSNILIGVRDQLYICWQSFQMLRVPQPYQAVGSGDGPALGALHALQPYDVPARQKVLAALQASAQFEPYVTAPFTIQSMEISSQ